MVPAYVPNPVAALCGGGTPIDFNRNYSDGRRILGDGKTYRGLVCGVLAGIAVGALQIWLAGLGLEFLPQHTAASIILLSVWGPPRGHGKEFYKKAAWEKQG